MHLQGDWQRPVTGRMLREGDPTFRDELLNYSRRGQILQISNFKDDSSPLAWDCSAWVRTYALFLEERLECFRILKYDIEAERLKKSAPGSAKHSRTRNLGCEDLLEQLPALQQLLYRLVGCQPEGGAFNNHLVQYALALVLKESFKIYCSMNDGIINLVDMFFDMSRHDAVKALNIYKRAGHQAQNLADFYEFCKGLELARNFQFPTLRQPPPSFLTTMEEYIREAPCTGSVANQRLEYQDRDLVVTCKPAEDSPPPESPKPTVEDDEEPAEEIQEPPQLNIEPALQPPMPAADTGDLLGLNEINPDAAAIEESNAMALAIVPPGDDSKPRGLSLSGLGSSGWELALVSTPSSNSSHLTESKLAGGFNKLLLDSLYDEAEVRRQQQNVGYGVAMNANPFDSQDPFSMSNGIAPPPNVQMALMAQQQQQHMMSMMMVPHPYPTHHHHPQQQQQMQMGTINPFGDPFTGVPQSAPQGNPSLL
ncbi:putative clathrin assembly protein At5g57200 isoform X2 [Magnolia sinica]|uniref:putative clathrin assembly protein At5g57200 isoform X2 n=1 Tax=Magnolia sinica TaxID=86752 RepID=UPI002658C60D|nr:putative clathrin assembly protein At5g57200 isoform X2 [Magnolia sinica]XP_058113592.1 putative clathrin assembly protein At5g57200 isoform X2 [Magnolia sinica]